MNKQEMDKKEMSRINTFLYRCENPEKYREIQRRWREKNKDYLKKYNQKKKEELKILKDKVVKYEDVIMKIGGKLEEIMKPKTEV